MAKFKPYNQKVRFLLPPSVEDFISADHLARVIDDIVEGLDVKEIEGRYSHLGQHAYHPRMLLKVLIYGYAIGVRSSRKIAARCETDTAFMFLSGMQRPNFRVISDFRKEFFSYIQGIFVQVIRVCSGLGMVKMGRIYIDGTKIRANGASSRTKNKEGYKKWLKRIEKEISEILEEARKIDEKEDKEYGHNKRGDTLPKSLRKKKALRKKIKEMMKKIKGDKEKVNLTDEDAKFIKERNGVIRTNYNPQVGVTEAQVIVAADVTNNACDAVSAVPVIKQAEENVGKKPDMGVLDSGYASLDNYEAIKKKGIVPLIPDKTFIMEREGKLNKEKHKFHRGNFTFDKEKNLYICPMGKHLTCYKEKEIEKDGKTHKFYYYKTKACKGCKFREQCCGKNSYRIIKRDIREDIVDGIRALLRSKEGKAEYKLRMSTVEPVFGIMKRVLGYTYFLVRTIPKVQGEFKLMCMAFNIRKIWKYKLENAGV